MSGLGPIKADGQLNTGYQWRSRRPPAWWRISWYFLEISSGSWEVRVRIANSGSAYIYVTRYGITVKARIANHPQPPGTARRTDDSDCHAFVDQGEVGGSPGRMVNHIKRAWRLVRKERVTVWSDPETRYAVIKVDDYWGVTRNGAKPLGRNGHPDIYNTFEAALERCQQMIAGVHLRAMEEVNERTDSENR